MTPHLPRRDALLYGGLFLLTLGIFVLDLWTPVEVGVAVLYIIPVLLTVFSSRERDPLYFCVLATGLLLIDMALKPEGSPILYDALNRMLGMLVMWGAALGLIRYKRTQQGLVAAKADKAKALQELISERVERAHAEGLMLAAQEARAYADTAVLGAVAGRHEVEEKLLASQLRLEGIIQSAMDGIVTVDDEQKVVLFNHAAEQMFGCSAQEAMGQSLDRFIPARYRANHHQHVAGFGKSGTSSRRIGTLGEVTGLHASGREFPVEAAISQIGVEGKKYFTVILRDVTGRKKVESTLRENEERFRLVALATNDVLWDWDLKSDKFWWSESAKAQFGYDADREPDIEAWSSRLHPDDREKVLASVQQAIRSGQAFWFGEYRFRTADGSDAVIFDRGHIVRDSGGNAVRMIGAMIDITQRKRAERLLRQSEERYRRLVAVSPDAIFVNRGDRIIFVNDQGVRLFGAVKAEEILGKSLFDLFHPDCHASIRNRTQYLMEEGRTTPLVDEKIIRLDGTTADVEVSAARFADEEGIGILVVLRDITERKRLQEQLRKTERLAELGTVASGMAHEIGTPMNVILGRAEYLMERVADEPIKKGLQTIVAQVERITKVMNQLLSFARRRAPERRAVDLKEVIETSVEIFQERLARNRIHVELALDDLCPKVHADADQMSQVLINLIMNAVHAMPEGGRLRIGVAQVNDMAQLTVADTGQGIPQEVVTQIFDPFFTTKDFGKGTGLGLTVVKGILEEHGASIAVESEPGKGTTFKILLPTDKTP